MADFPEIPRGRPLQGPAVPNMLPGMRGFVVNEAVTRAAGNVPTIDARGFVAEAGAMSAVGEGLQNLGGTLEKIAGYEAEIRTRSDVLEAEDAMVEFQKDIATRIINEPDQRNWVGIAEKGAAEAEATWMKKGLAPNALRTVREKFSAWRGKVVSDTTISAAQRTRDNYGAGLQKRVIESVDRGDLPGALAAIDEREKSGVVNAGAAAAERVRAGEGVERRTHLKKAEAFNTAQNAAISATGAAGEEEALKGLDAGLYGDLDASDRERIRGVIRQVARDRSAAAMDDVSIGILSGDINSPAAIDALDSPFLTPVLRQSAKEYLQSFDAYLARQDREVNGVRNAVEMRQKVRDYDPAKDPDRTGQFTLLREIGSRVEQSAQGEIIGALYQKSGATKPKLQVRPEIAQYASKTLDILFDPEAGAIPWRSRSKDPQGHDMTTDDLAAKDRAQAAQTTVEMAMNDWMERFPEEAASVTKVRAKLQELLPEGTRAAALATMMKNGPPKPAGAPLDDTLVSIVKGMEGYKAAAYGDEQQASVGYGTRAKSVDEVLTEPEAEARLREELAGHAARIDEAAASRGIRLTTNQRRALIAFDFNTGSGVNILRTSGGDIKEMRRRMLLHNKAGGKDSQEVTFRRGREMSVFDYNP